jgi:hypothetical protein
MDWTNSIRMAGRTTDPDGFALLALLPEPMSADDVAVGRSATRGAAFDLAQAAENAGRLDAALADAASARNCALGSPCATKRTVVRPRAARVELRLARARHLVLSSSPLIPAPIVA